MYDDSYSDEPRDGLHRVAMAKRRNKRSSKTSMPKAAPVISFTAFEEAFFAAGESIPHLEQINDDTHEAERPSLWRRLLTRATLAA